MSKELRRPRLTITQILAWADAHQRHTGSWPTLDSGLVSGVANQTWAGVDSALRQGLRGLPGGSTLTRLLAESGREGGPKRKLPHLAETQILSWADEHQRQTGKWPSCGSGAIPGSEGETWSGVDHALRGGLRGLAGGWSLAQFLAASRRKRRGRVLALLTVEQIETWIRQHFRRTGEWPNERSGPVHEAPQETWQRLHSALQGGNRGLPVGTTLARLVRRLNYLWLRTEYVPIRAQWMNRKMPRKIEELRPHFLSEYSTYSTRLSSQKSVKH